MRPCPPLPEPRRLIVPPDASGPDLAPDPDADPDPDPDRYLALPDGFLYASARLQSPRTTRPSAVLLLSACGTPFTLGLGGRPLTLRAAVVRPMVARSLAAHGCRLVSLNAHPTHPQFTRFAALPAPGAMALEAAAFDGHTAALQAFFAPQPPAPDAARRLADALLATLWPLLPPPPAPDPLRPVLLAWLAGHPDGTLAALAAHLGLSYHRMSHRFTQAMGLTFRQWQAFARTRRAAGRLRETASLTRLAHEAGYTDSAHLTHTWQRVYGLSPSRLRRGNSVQVIA